MKKLFTLLFWAFSLCIAGAVDYNCNIIGKNTDKASGKNDYVIFDGSEKTYLGWQAKPKSAVKGFTVNFYRVQKVNKIVLLTDKNVQSVPVAVERWQSDNRFRWIDFDKNAVWKRTEQNSKAVFVFEGTAADTFAVRVTIKDAKFRIYECAVYSIDADGKSILLTEKVKKTKAPAVDVVPDPKKDMISGNLRMTLWLPGGVGKKKKAFFVGRPNTTNRNDRVLVRFDCTDFVAKGSVSRAELCFNVTPFGKAKKSKIFMLEYLPVANSELIKNDMSQSKTEVVAQFIVEDYRKPAEFKIDLTGVINKALYNGTGFMKFRFRDLEAENSRNIEKKSSAISLSRVKLTIEP